VILPSESLGVVAYAANDLRVEPIPLREPAANEAVVEVAYGGICGSDLLIDRTSHRPAPTLAAPPGSRIATGRS
jgi:threonine dehydrogenase-like Zn-dependent dehydrogenase